MRGCEPGPSRQLGLWQSASVTDFLSRLAIPSEDQQRLDFLLTAHRLTSVTRVNQLLDASRGESSAEHSWHLALAALVLAPRFAPQVDLARVVTMVVLHDLVEVEAGDVPIYDEQGRRDVVPAEQAAAERIFARLPPEQAGELLALWQEAEEVETDDARFAKALDRLQPLLLHWAGDGAAWAARGVTVNQERRLVGVVHDYWPPLGSLVDDLISDAYRRRMLRDGDASEADEPGPRSG